MTAKVRPGRPRLKASQRRTQVIKVGTTKRERQTIEAMAEQAGYATVAAYLRDRGLAS